MPDSGRTPATVRERAKHRFPAVLLTVLSIMQALALEVLWSSLKGHDHLWHGGLVALVGWLQVVAVFGGIVIVWVFYTSMVMRLVWVPSVRDSVIPFILGVMEFTLAEILAPEYMHLWLYLMALMFLFSTTASSRTFIKARRDPDNFDFFKNFEEFNLGSFVVPGAAIALIVASGLVVQIWGPGGARGLVAILVTNAVLVAELFVLRGFWKRSIEGNQT